MAISGNDVLDFSDSAAMDAVKTLLDDGSEGASRALLVAGAPGSGKTEFALAATLEGISRYGDSGVFMAVSGRRVADKLSDRIIRSVGSVSSARPVTTLSAIAFRLLSSQRRRKREPLPKLLNGAEQDALLRQVVAVHVGHARSGELCDTCELMRQYFAADDWVNTVYDDDGSETGGRPRGVDDEARGSMPGQQAVNASGTDGQVRPTSGVQLRSTSKGIGSSDVLFTRGINDAFVMQLRDMLARMDELGLGAEREDEVLQLLADSQDSGEGYSLRIERLGVQWRLAFALRREYAKATIDAYPGEFRLDSSRLLVEGAQAAAQIADSELPKFVVVDDFQDLTLAGLAFLEALVRRGVKLLLVGNPDEAVQTFRGSYPEYLFERAQQPPLSAELMMLPVRQIREGNDSSYLDLLASRVSLSIAANEDTSVALPDRPGKLPQFAGSLPIAALDTNDPKPKDNSVKTALYRNPREELDDVVWRIKEAHLSSGRQWNDFAVIAHDNDTVRAFGERLRGDGVPVHYSAVTKPLKDDPSVQGLFALLELAKLRHDGIDASNMSLAETARYVRGRVQTVLESPLVSLRSSSSASGPSSPARLAPVESVMKAIASLAHVIDESAAGLTQPTQDATLGEVSDSNKSTLDDIASSDSDSKLAGSSSPDSLDSSISGKGENAAGQTDIVDVTAALPRLQQEWRELRDRVVAGRKQGDVQVDNSLIDANSDGAGDESDMPLGVDALYVMLAFDSAENPSENVGSQEQAETDGKQSPDSGEVHGLVDEVLELIGKVGGDAYTRVFAHVWDLAAKVEQGLSALPSREPQYALGLAWDACHVANAWQVQALANNADGRAANDRLDVMMRLFAYASGSGAKQSVEDFIASVRSMRIEADSLAKVAPIDQAVTLTTPAGAAGGHWPFVFITEIQQDVWPNLAARNTMFGGENLADIVLHNGIRDERELGMSGTDPELAQVLSAEQKSFLVALTRASEQVTLSAVLSDDAVPSDFLYTYVPERFDRLRDADLQTRDYTQLADSGRFAGLDTDPRGLVAASRIELMRQADATVNTHGDVDEVNSPQLQNKLDVSSSAAHVSDAAVSLVLLDDAGLEAADPDSWPYTFDTPNSTGVGAQSETVQNADTSESSSSAPTVTLSPSQVDRIWACPVCWMLESQFAGPRPSNAATSFGTLIHRVAQLASEAGLDAPDFMAGSSEDERIKAITVQMMDMYHELASDLDTIDDPEQRYRAESKDEGAQQTLTNIATYFVTSNDKDYPYGNLKNFAVGRLQHADSEYEFAARFGLDDICAAYNAIEGVDPIDIDELAAIMGVLNGGWPEGMSPDLQIRLTGRIDRMEWRDLGDGKEHVRLIDWKTGHAHNGKQMFNDLQLVCYQLGLAFPEANQSEKNDDGSRTSAILPNAGLHGAEALKAMPDITQSALFDVDSATAPALGYRVPETLFQPPLFHAGGLNSTGFTPRSHYSNLQKLADLPDLPDKAPQGVSAHAWQQFLSLRGTQAVWALTMISRIFYAAAASRSSVLVARPQPDHVAWCNMKTVCPACAGEVDTVYEVRKG